MARYDDLLEDLLNEDADERGTVAQLNDAEYTLACDDQWADGSGASQQWRHGWDTDRAPGSAWYETPEQEPVRGSCMVVLVGLGGGLLAGGAVAVGALVHWFA